MIIRKAAKQDFKEYVALRKESIKEHSKLLKEKLMILTKSQINKELKELFSKRNVFLIAEEDKKIAGYLIGTLFKEPWQRMGYVDDLFILKNFRKRGIAKLLVKEFIKIVKKEGLEKCSLGLIAKNKKALSLYSSLGFKIARYEMAKKLK